MRTLSGHTAPVLCVAYSHDGRRLASGSEDQTVRLWDVPTGEPLFTLPRLDGPILSLAFAPDGKFLAIGGHGQVSLWNLTTGKAGPVIRNAFPGTYVVAFSPDSGSVTLASYLDSGLRRFDLVRVRPLAALSGHAGVLALAHSRDGRWLVSGGGLSESGLVVLWDLGLNRRAGQGRHDRPVQAVAFSPDGQCVAAGGSDRVVHVWPLETLTARSPTPTVLTLPHHPAAVAALAFTANSQALASASADGTIQLWDHRSGQRLASWDWQIGKVRSMVFSPDGMTAAAGGADNSVLVWDLE